MIRSFADRDTKELFVIGKNRRFTNIAKVALRKLDYMRAAVRLSDLNPAPGNRL